MNLILKAEEVKDSKEIKIETNKTMITTPKRIVKKSTKLLEQTEPTVDSPKPQPTSNRKRVSLNKRQSIKKSPRPVRTPVPVVPKVPPLSISPPMRTLPSTLPSDYDKDLFKQAQEVAERQFVTTILTPLKRQPNVLCETKVWL